MNLLHSLQKGGVDSMRIQTLSLVCLSTQYTGKRRLVAYSADGVWCLVFSVPL